MSLIQEKAAAAIKSLPLESYTGRIIACDASMSIYQFLISTMYVREGEGAVQELKDKEGNPTAHLIGIYYRTLQLLEHGIKPIWVFDGKPPEMKMEELSKRKDAKIKAEEQKVEAIKEGNMELAKKMAQRSVKVTPKMTEDAKKLVSLMGAPVIEAPSEAEAQCAAMCKAGLVYGTASEDMDSLTFGTNILLRGFNNKKEPITQIDLSEVLKGFGMNMDEFIDLCIMCGCDYTNSVDGIGPIKAYKFMKEGKSIEKVLALLDKYNSNPAKKKKYIVPADFNYVKSREMFKNPDVTLKVEMKWNKADSEGLHKFMVEEKNFSEARFQSGMKKITVIVLSANAFGRHSNKD